MPRPGPGIFVSPSLGRCGPDTEVGRAGGSSDEAGMDLPSCGEVAIRNDWLKRKGESGPPWHHLAAGPRSRGGIGPPQKRGMALQGRRHMIDSEGTAAMGPGGARRLRRAPD